MLVACGAYAILDPIPYLLNPTAKNARIITLSVVAVYIANLCGLIALTATLCELVDVQLKFEASNPTASSSLLHSSGEHSAMLQAYRTTDELSGELTQRLSMLEPTDLRVTELGCEPEDSAFLRLSILGVRNESRTVIVP
jgi:hypothetical protein